MPVRLRYALAGPAPAHPYQHASGLRALVLRWIQREDPNLSAAIHDANQSKPYSIGPLWSDAPGRCHFDVSVLADSVLEPMIRGAARHSEEVRLGTQRYRIDKPEVAEEATWESLLAPRPDGAPLRKLDFRLLSPTAHHLPGPLRKSVVLPSPELYFRGWLGRWNLCCETPIDESLGELVAERVAVAACRGETQAVRLDGTRSFIGFVGQVRFGILKPEELRPEAAQALRALARFGAFCGTGVDTMRGMGQTAFLGE